MEGEALSCRENLFRPLSTNGIYQRVFSVFAQWWKFFLIIHTVANLLYFTLSFAILKVFEPYPSFSETNGTSFSTYNSYEQDNNVNNYGDYVDNGDDGDNDDMFSSYYEGSEIATFWDGDNSNYNDVYSQEWFLHVSLWDQLVFAMIMGVASGATIYATAMIYAGQVKPNMGDSVKGALLKFGALVGSSLLLGLMFLAMSLGYVLFVTAFTSIGLSTASDNGAVAVVILLDFLFTVAYIGLLIWFAVRTCFIHTVIMVEHFGVCSSVSRSMALTDRFFCEVFGSWMPFWSIRFNLTLLEQSLMGWPAATYPPSSLLLSPAYAFVTIVLAIVFSTFGSILQAVLYMDIRIRQDAYTPEKLAEELGVSGDEYVDMKEGQKVGDREEAYGTVV